MHNCSGDEYGKGHRHTYSALEARGSRAMHTGPRTHRHRKLQKHNQTTQTRPFTFIRPILSDFQKAYHFFATTYERARTHTRTHNGTGKFLHARGMCRMPARAFQESHCGTNNGVVYLHHKLNCVWNRHPNHCDALKPDLIVTKVQTGERRALPQHPRQPPCTFRSYVIASKIQLGE